jgi:beta-1,4-mannosyltransferase
VTLGVRSGDGASSSAPVPVPAPVAAGRLTVLHSLRPPGADASFATLMRAAAPPGVTLRFFRWRTALLGRYDVLHVHWPELLLRDSRRPWVRPVKRALFRLLLLRLRLQRIPLVWTAHNPRPHEAGTPAEERALRRFTGAVDLTIRLNPASPVVVGRDTVTVPHGDYRAAFAAHRLPDSDPGVVLHFGIIRPYKGVDTLVDAFTELPDPRLRLRIVGAPHPGQDAVVRAAAERDGRITSLLRFVSDAELVAEIGRAQLVVLPYRGVMHNSGALLAALSLGRPVLVPASPTNAALAAEVGTGWVHQYSGELTTDVLATALEATRIPPGAPPRLDGREPAAVAAQLLSAYRRARNLRGRR